jgi:hypothetical protein
LFFIDLPIFNLRSYNNVAIKNATFEKARLMKTYTLKKHPQTNQYHLFEGRLNPPDSETKCTSEKKSVCEKMSWVEGSKFSCETDEKIVRLKCAELGREVCGVCISHMYADPQ